MTTICGPIREFRRIVERGDVKTGCDYRTLPNWLRSGQQTGHTSRRKTDVQAYCEMSAAGLFRPMARQL